MADPQLEIQRTRWDFVTLRFTGFFASEKAPDIALLFKAAWGLDSTTDVFDAKKNKRTLTGIREGYQLIFSKNPQRIDVFLQPVRETGKVDEQKRSEKNEATRELFKAIYINILRECHIFNRVAVGIVYQHSEQSIACANKTLSEFLPSVKIDIEDSRDFFYRINRPRILELGKSTCLINKVSSWACVTSVNITFNPSMQLPTAPTTVYAARLDTDINTVPTVNLENFPHEDKIALLHRLNDLSEEIAKKGDVK